MAINMTDSEIYRHCILQGLSLGPKPTTSSFESCSQLSKSCQKLDVILENKLVYKLKFSKHVNDRNVPLK